MPIVDKTGQVFGRLTVLRLSKKRHPTNNKILWECQCSCGNPEIVYATTGNLTQGYKTSCGCMKAEGVKKAAAANRLNLSGRKFGKLTVQYYIENTSPPLWHCLCECGNEIDVISTSLTRGNTVSCGCRRKDLRHSLEGQVFGRLTVIERAENYISPSGQNLIRYKCKCECGNETIVMATSLVQGLTSSCGCLRSAGELQITQFLQKINCKFEREYRFPDCKDERPLPFDFCIFDDNNNIKLLIEINGKQHYEPRFVNSLEEGKKNLQKQQKHDLIKQLYCIEHNLNLLIIPYYELNQYEKIINERLKSL